jgi:hypothetical protein
VPAFPPLRWQSDNQPLFPDICAGTEKWFRRTAELFRRPVGTKQWGEKLNDFSRMNPVRRGLKR